MALTITPDMYVTEAELFAEQVIPASPTTEQEARAEMLARHASRYIDRMTRRWFYPRAYTLGSELYLDGSGAAHLHLPAPIIAIDRVELLSADRGWWSTLPASAYVAYLHDGMGANADNPKIVATTLLEPVSAGLSRSRPRWPAGQLNVRVRCTLGYVDPEGAPPPAIRRAAMRLMAFEAETIGDDDGAELRALRAGLYTTYSVHNRSITLAGLAQSGRFTGDALIDSTIMQYRLPVL